MASFEDIFGGQTELERESILLESLALSIQVALQKAMNERGVSQKDLAERLKISPARVSQILKCHGANLTLRSVAKIAYALGEEFELVSKKEMKYIARTNARSASRNFGESLLQSDKCSAWHEVSANNNKNPKRIAA